MIRLNKNFTITLMYLSPNQEEIMMREMMQIIITLIDNNGIL